MEGGRESKGEIELYNDWFGQADVDRDNRLSGSEAVSFFSKSGLHKQTLFKIWQGVAGDRPYLSRQEFYTAMKLVAVAQGHGGVLDDGVMARIINGLGERVGVPRMAGLNDDEVSSRSAASVPVVPSRSSVTHASHQEQQDGFPVMTAEKARVYQTAFEQLDTTNRQLLTGAACFGAFMQSGVSKGMLKDIWDVVAGNSGELNRHQFIQCMYLIDWVKGAGFGRPIPKALPAQFPPVSKEGGVVSTPLGAGDIFSGSRGGGIDGLTGASMPDKAVFAGSGVGGAVASTIPDYTGAAQFTSLSSQEQANLAEQERLAKYQEEQLARAEQQRKEIAARQQFYTSALADLRLSQSKSSRGLIEAEQRLEMERKACEEMEAQYEAAYDEFNEQHARIGPVLKTLEEVEAQKAALVSKKAALEAAVKNLEEYDPEWEARERGACETLRIEIAELVATHAALEKSTEAMKRRQASMVDVIDGLKLNIEAEKEQVGVLKQQVDALDEEKLRDGEVLVGLLQQVVPMYTRLYAASRDALVPLPNDVVLGGGKSSTASNKARGFEYDAAKFGAYDCTEWHVFQEEEFSIATVIPVDDRMETFISPSVRVIEEDRALADDVGAVEVVEVVSEIVGADAVERESHGGHGESADDAVNPSEGTEVSIKPEEATAPDAQASKAEAANAEVPDPSDVVMGGEETRSTNATESIATMEGINAAEETKVTTDPM